MPMPPMPPPPLKLVDIATEVRDAAKKVAMDAAKTFGEAQTEIAAQRQARDIAAEALTDQLTEVERARRQLSLDHTPAELLILSEALRLLLIEVRELRQARLEAEAALALAEAALPPAAAATVAAKAPLELAEKRLAEAKEGAAKRATWLLKLAAPPVSDFKALAQALLADPDPEAPYRAARDRVEGDIPPALRTRARARAASAAAAAKATADALAAASATFTTFRQAELGPEAPFGAAQAAFAKADGALRDVVLHGQNRLDQALALLAGIDESRQLVASDHAAVTAAATAGSAAALLEEKRDLATQALADKEAEIAAKELELLALDVDTDLANDPDILMLEDEAGDLQDLLTTAQTNFSALHRQALDDWEAAVPDFAWANLSALDRATALLNELVGIDAMVLENDLSSREDTLAKALRAADKYRRTRELLAGVVAARRPAADVAAAFLDRRQIAALRGDRHN